MADKKLILFISVALHLYDEYGDSGYVYTCATYPITHALVHVPFVCSCLHVQTCQQGHCTAIPLIDALETLGGLYMTWGFVLPKLKQCFF